MQALPGLSAHANHRWDPDLLLAFGEAFLVWLKDQAARNPGKQLHCTCDPSKHSIQCEVMEDGDMPARLQQLLAE